MRRKFAVGLAAVLLAAGLVAFSPVDPVPWTPPSPYLAAGACRQRPAATAQKLASGLPGKADGLAFAPDGRLLAALNSGDVVAVDRRSGRWSVAASGAGGLTGLAAAPDGALYAVDEQAGALFTAPIGGRLRKLTDRVGQTRLRWTNDVTVSGHNVFVTTTATGRSLDDFYREILEHRGSGLLLRHDRLTGATHIVARHLRMTNGVAATADGGLLVAESAVYGVTRFTPDGRRAAAIEGLPGFTGNIRASDRPGVFWLTLLSPRSDLIDGLAGAPWARRLLAWLPAVVRPGPVALPCVVEITLAKDGLRARALRIAGAETSFSTAIEREGRLYLSPASIVAGSEASLYVADLPAA